MKIFSLAATLCILTAGFANAEIILSTTSTPLDGGLVQYTVAAQGTAGESINTFSNMNLTGRLHQVYNVSFGGPAPSPDVDSHNAGGTFDSQNAAYDTYFTFASPFAFSNAEVSEPVGDEATKGSVPLAVGTIFGQEVSSGYSSSLSLDPIDGAITLLPAAAGSDLSFLQVVLAEGESASLDVRIDSPSNGGVVGSFQGYVIGGGAPIPEPATAGLAGLAIAGVLGFRRRR